MKVLNIAMLLFCVASTTIAMNQDSSSEIDKPAVTDLHRQKQTLHNWLESRWIKPHHTFVYSKHEEGLSSVSLTFRYNACKVSIEAQGPSAEKSSQHVARRLSDADVTELLGLFVLRLRRKDMEVFISIQGKDGARPAIRCDRRDIPGILEFLDACIDDMNRMYVAH